MRDSQLHRARIVSSVAATVVSLACGTNYVYSAWAPQFADRLRLSSTESNLVGLAGNLGMYTLGLPIGIFIDRRGPRIAVLAGAVFLGMGYFALHRAYDDAAGSILVLCLFSYLTGLGGCMAFLAAVKTSALNWPSHRGSATGFPLAAFGLSAFFFSVAGSVLFPGDPSAFLAILAAGTFCLTFAGFFFMRVVPVGAYEPVSSAEAPENSAPRQRRRPLADEDKGDGLDGCDGLGVEAGTCPDVNEPPLCASPTTSPISGACRAGTSLSTTRPAPLGLEPPNSDAGGQLLSRSPSDEMSRPFLAELRPSPSGSSAVSGHDAEQNLDEEAHSGADFRGLELLRLKEFWQLWIIMGIFSGIGLMTINNIGNNVTALWRHYDKSVDESFLLGRQQIHVSALSICSFCGRLLSGLGSDFLVKVLRASRIWCLVAASAIFFAAQVCALNLEDPNSLALVSGLSGLGYGFLFGVLPSIVAETFGVQGLSQNWGMMILSPVVSGYIFNVFYGSVYDSHSVVGPGGDRTCTKGLECYRDAYWVTLGACFLGLGITLWVIRRQRATDKMHDGTKSRD